MHYAAGQDNCDLRDVVTHLRDDPAVISGIHNGED